MLESLRVGLERRGRLSMQVSDAGTQVLCRRKIRSGQVTVAALKGGLVMMMAIAFSLQV